ncbi:MAG: hypothetical protein R2941_00780 [Desulfobacterales bacterium]
MKNFSQLWIVAAFLLILATGLSGCGDSGGMDDGEDSGTPVIVAPEPVPAFCHRISEENRDEPFHVYGTTEIRIRVSGENCEYSFELLAWPGLTVCESLLTGTGETEEKLYYHLPDGDYLISADTECTWQALVSDTSGCPGF